MAAQEGQPYLRRALGRQGQEDRDIGQTLYQRAKAHYAPADVSPFIYAHPAFCAPESESGEIFTGFCIESASGVMNLCAERAAIPDTRPRSGQTVVRRMIAFCDKPPYGGGSGMSCGACRELLMQLSEKNADMQIMAGFATRETVALRELLPRWWGGERREP